MKIPLPSATKRKLLKAMAAGFIEPDEFPELFGSYAPSMAFLTPQQRDEEIRRLKAKLFETD